MNQHMTPPVEAKATSKKQKMNSVDAQRATAAQQIRKLSQAWGENAILLGLEFAKVRDTFPQKGTNGERRAAQHAERPGWREWIVKNTSWSIRQVNSFIRVAEKFGNEERSSRLSFRVLELLAREYVTEEARALVIERATNGKPVTRGEAEEIVLKRGPKPKCLRSRRRAGDERAELEWQSSLIQRAHKSASEAELPKEWLDGPPEAVVILAVWQAADAWKALAEYIDAQSGKSPEEIAKLKEGEARAHARAHGV